MDNPAFNSTSNVNVTNATPSMDGSPPIVHFSGEEFWTEDPTREPAKPRGDHGSLCFQHGPIKEAGVNGTTIEAVQRALINRLRGFNDGPFRCRENSLAITHMEEALHWLDARTRARQHQNVEGTNEAHVS